MRITAKHKDQTILVFDLFAGAGGLSLGAARAGFTVAAAVEIDKHASHCHETNFPNTHHINIGVENISGADIRRIAADRPFGIIGGPPCQGFSRIGKRDPADRRNTLFHHFFRIVREAQPEFYLAENVPGILDPEFTLLRTQALEQVEGFHNTEPLQLDASEFGAATKRKRVFFIGFKHRPRGINIAERARTGVVKTPVSEALFGLDPFVSPDWQSEPSSWKTVTKYTDSDFGCAMRDNIPDGVGSRATIERLKRDSLVSGFFGTRHSREVVRRFARVRQGSIDPISRAFRLSSSGFCPTLRAGTDSTRGSFQALRPIHPDEHRMITPREAARLQGFPDWFEFSPTKWHSFRQIGNSVSPLLSTRILRTVRDIL